MQQQVNAGESMQELNKKIERLTEAVSSMLRQRPSTPQGNDQSTARVPQPADTLTTHNPDDASMKTSSTGSSQEVMASPQHKKQRSGKTDEDENEDMAFCSVSSNQASDDTQTPDDQIILPTNGDETNALSHTPQSLQQTTQDQPRSRSKFNNLADVTAVLEARYNEPNAPGGGDAT